MFKKYKTIPSKTFFISKKDVNLFSAVSGDYAPLHSNLAFAKKHDFSGRIAHGLLIGAKLSGFIGMKFPGKNSILKSISINFRNPVIPPKKMVIKCKIIGFSKSTKQISLSFFISDGKKIIFANGTFECILLK